MIPSACTSSRGSGLSPGFAPAKRTAAWCPEHCVVLAIGGLRLTGVPLMDRFFRRQPADTEVCDLKRPATVPAADKNIGGFQIAVDDCGALPVCKCDDPGKVEDDLGHLVSVRRQCFRVKSVQNARQVAVFDALVFQKRRVGPKVCVQQLDNAVMFAGTRDMIEQIALAFQRAAAPASRQNLRATGGCLGRSIWRAFHTSPKPPRPRNSINSRSPSGNGRSPGLKRGDVGGRNDSMSLTERNERPAGTVVPVSSAGRRRLRRIDGGTWDRYWTIASRSAGSKCGASCSRRHAPRPRLPSSVCGRSFPARSCCARRFPFANYPKYR